MRLAREARSTVSSVLPAKICIPMPLHAGGISHVEFLSDIIGETSINFGSARGMYEWFLSKQAYLPLQT